MIPPFIYRQLTSRSFWLSVFMVLCIKTLPDLALALMNYYFDETRSPFVHRYLDFRDDNHDGIDDRDEQQEEITTGGSNDSAMVVVVDENNEMKDPGTLPPPPGATSLSASLDTFNLEMVAAAPPFAVVDVPSMLETTKTSEILLGLETSTTMPRIILLPQSLNFCSRGHHIWTTTSRNSVIRSAAVRHSQMFPTRETLRRKRMR
jgi:hypothetical protein